MSEPFLAEIRLFAGNFAPRGWLFCDGQLLLINQNSALFSLLGTNFGGDGRTTFGLPDLRGRVPIHAGGSDGPGLRPYRLGEKGGAETVAVTTTLSQSDDAHAHEVLGSSAGSGVGSTSVTTVREATGASSTTNSASNIQPYQALNYIIAIVGTFPSRN
jgi:microcystin-dependent protein